MPHAFTVTIADWEDGATIPEPFAFAKQDPDSHIHLSDNLNPHIRWENAPEGTRSFAIICHDPNVPSSGEDVNQEGKSVPADLPRVDFYHWVLVDIPTSISEIAQGAASQGVTPKGKALGTKTYGVAGINDYTGWFAGDGEMGGDYGDYDGPCPPWNDSIMHHYHFRVYALDIASLGLSGRFSGQDALAAMEGHILASDDYMGCYSLNPNI